MEVDLPLVMYRQTSKPPHGADWVTMRYRTVGEKVQLDGLGRNRKDE